MEADFNNCPNCGARVKGRTSQPDESQRSDEAREKVASGLTALGVFLFNISRWIKSAVIATIAFLGKYSQKFSSWLRSIDWSKSKEIFHSIKEKITALLQTVSPRIKKAAGNTWQFLEDSYSRLRGSLSHLLEKKLSPDLAKKAAIGIIIACIVMCFLLFIIIVSGPADSSNNALTVEHVQDDTPLPAVDPSQQKWLVMIYADADDEVLESVIYFDLNEAEAAGSSERVQIVAQIDRFTGGYTGDGDWTGARRYFITPDEDLNVIHSDLTVDLGEIDMGSANTLVDFAAWAIQTYPADRYALILSDYGSGWIGG